MLTNLPIGKPYQKITYLFLILFFNTIYAKDFTESFICAGRKNTLAFRQMIYKAGALKVTKIHCFSKSLVFLKIQNASPDFQVTKSTKNIVFFQNDNCY